MYANAERTARKRSPAGMPWGEDKDAGETARPTAGGSEFCMILLLLRVYFKTNTPDKSAPDTTGRKHQSGRYAAGRNYSSVTAKVYNRWRRTKKLRENLCFRPGSLPLRRL